MSAIEEKKLTYAEVGAKINKSKKTVPSYFSKATLPTDLLVAFSKALNEDFLKHYYEEEPMKSLRHDEITKLNNKVQRLTEKYEHLHEKFELAMQVIEAHKNALLLKDILERYAPRDVYTPSMNEEKNLKQVTNLPMVQEDKTQDDPNS